MPKELLIKTSVDPTKIHARVDEFLERCYERPLEVSEQHYLTLRVFLEPGGFVWLSEEGLQASRKL